jgi:hypothetical protein
VASNPVIIIKSKKEKTSILTDVAKTGMHAKGSRKKLQGKIQEITYRDITNGNADNNWGHRNSNKRFKGKFGNHSRKTSNRLTAKELYLEHHT